MIENNHNVAQGSGCDEEPISKGNREILGSDGIVLYLNWVVVSPLHVFDNAEKSEFIVC